MRWGGLGGGPHSTQFRYVVECSESETVNVCGGGPVSLSPKVI